MVSSRGLGRRSGRDLSSCYPTGPRPKEPGSGPLGAPHGATRPHRRPLELRFGHHPSPGFAGGVGTLLGPSSRAKSKFMILLDRAKGGRATRHRRVPPEARGFRGHPVFEGTSKTGRRACSSASLRWHARGAQSPRKPEGFAALGTRLERSPSSRAARASLSSKRSTLGRRSVPARIPPGPLRAFLAPAVAFC